MAPPRTWAEKKALDVLVGIELGVLGGLLMLACFALSAPLIGESWWTILNLFASAHYSSLAVRYGPGIVTLSGCAIQLTLAGLVGGLDGFLTRGGRLFGLGVAFLWYFLSYEWLWSRYAPLLMLYAPQPLLMIGFFIYGSALGWHRHLIRRMYEPAMAPPPLPAREPAQRSSVSGYMNEGG